MPEEARRKAVYNVYNQRIDGTCPQMVHAVPVASAHWLPTRWAGHLMGHTLVLQDPRNNMPAEPNQQPFPGQRKPISTTREPSSIPKGGTEATWVYPSPQMFYNGTHAHASSVVLQMPSASWCIKVVNAPSCMLAALKRKGKGDDVTEDDMGAVVHAHNSERPFLVPLRLEYPQPYRDSDGVHHMRGAAMNEVTWQHVLAWEALHAGECGQPQLLRFCGRPDELR